MANRAPCDRVAMRPSARYCGLWQERGYGKGRGVYTGVRADRGREDRCTDGRAVQAADGEEVMRRGFLGSER